MDSTKPPQQAQARVGLEQPRAFAAALLSGYGMVFVLLGLMLLFTLLTWKEQMPVGVDAARQVADKILAANRAATVVVVGGQSSDETEFVRGVSDQLTAGGASVIGTVNGQPVDARTAITQAIAAGRPPTHIAVSGTANRWTVFDRLDNVDQRGPSCPHALQLAGVRSGQQPAQCGQSNGGVRGNRHRHDDGDYHGRN